MRLKPLLFFFLAIVITSCNQKIHTKEYVVKKIISEPLTIDGQGSEEEWNQAENLTDFTYHWRDEIVPKTSFKALWDDQNLYFLYQVEDEEIILKNDSTVDEEHEAVGSDRVEIFFKSVHTSKPYYTLEMDALGRTLDAEGEFSIKNDHNWDWPKEDIVVKTSVYDRGYVVEGSISLSSIITLVGMKDNQLHAGLYRGEYVQSGSEKPQVKWISWVKPDSDTPNFHTSSSFGILRLEQ